ncbi:hypothetical protein MBORA_15790 [Methanobrevibacter oralis]|uniref:DUF4411 family protein n=1 Tax=Methanobrevibacter oralis TaxID=66851 RepID=A0A165ZYK8_METOA|nr:DUF4411 family protein [Methanobrevibacter oralis]KZX11334.1 hypothetical protein MBORA_15790 [Methanobrevibacter oralis]
MSKYIIDSSSLDELEDKYPMDISVFEPIYSKLNQMFENGNLFSIREVYEELRDSQEYWDDYEECFRELTEKESENVTEILDSEEFSVFVNWGLKENDGHWADPHLVACAMEDSNLVIISEESSRNKPQRKIPYVCSKKGIRCIKLLEFLREIEIL